MKSRSKTPEPKSTIVVHGAPSWRLKNARVDAQLTVTGGHLAPVTFHTAAGPVQPFAVAPWLPTDVDVRQDAVLRPLRGDFFCMPFGGGTKLWKGERHPAHGETATAPWQLRELAQDNGSARLVATIATKVRAGRVTKTLALRKGHAVVYCTHEVAGMSGPMNIGHHAMLKFPDEPNAGRVSFSGYRFGQVCPVPFEDPGQGGYSALQTGALFQRLSRVPLAAGGTADLTRYPARAGFEDLLLLATKQNSPLAWTAVTFPGQKYVWFAVKDPRVLASTVLWHSNGGRHYPPWNGRHRSVLGLEEVTSYFHLGLAASAVKNDLNARGVPTVVQLSPKRPLVVRYAMGVAAIPRGFDVVKKIRFERDGVELEAASGARVSQPFDTGFFG